MPTPEVITKVVDAYVDAYRRNDRQAAIDLFHPEAVWHDPVGAPPHVGHQGIGEFWDQGHAMADTIELVPTDVIVAGNEAALVMTINVVIGDGGMEMDCVETFELDEDGKIILAKAYWDMTRVRPRNA